MAVELTAEQQEVVDATAACLDTLFGVDAMELLIQSLVQECLDAQTVKFEPGTFIPLCFHQKVTACWHWDNGPGDDIVPNILSTTGDLPGVMTVNTNAGAASGPVAAGAPGDWTDQFVSGLVPAFDAIDPHGNSSQMAIYPAGDWRVLEVKTTDLTQEYGPIVIEPTAPSRPTHTMYASVEFLTECLVEGIICNEDGSSSPAWQDYQGNTVEAPTAAELAEFQASKCPVPTTALPSPIAPDVIPDPVALCDQVAECLVDPETNPITKQFLAEILQDSDLDEDGMIGRIAATEAEASQLSVRSVTGERIAIRSLASSKRVAVKSKEAQ